MARVWIAAFLQAKSAIKNCRITKGYLAPFAPALMGLRLLSFQAFFPVKE